MKEEVEDTSLFLTMADLLRNYKLDLDLGCFTNFGNEELRAHSAAFSPESKPEDWDFFFKQLGTETMSVEQLGCLIKWGLVADFDRSVLRDAQNGPLAFVLGPASEMLRDAPITDDLKLETLGKVVSVLVNKVVPVVAEKIFAVIDQDNSGGITREEIVTFCVAIVQGMHSGGFEQMSGLAADFGLAVLDVNKNGVIEPEEIAQFFVRLTTLSIDCAEIMLDIIKENICEASLSTIVGMSVANLDTDGDGMLSQDEVPMEMVLDQIKQSNQMLQQQAQYGDPVSAEILKVRDFVLGLGAEAWTRDEFCEMLKMLLHGRIDTGIEMMLEMGSTGSEDVDQQFVEYVRPQFERLADLLKSDKFDEPIKKLSNAIFTVCDCDKDGSLTVEELMAYGGLVSETLPEGEEGDAVAKGKIDLIWKSFDVDGDGKLSSDELTAKGMEVFEIVFEIAKMVCNINSAIAAAWCSTTFKELIDGAKMMFKLDGRPITFDKEGLKKAILACLMGECIENEAAGAMKGAQFDALPIWIMGMMIAGGRTEEEFRTGCFNNEACTIL